MISIIITSWNEPETISFAIKKIIENKLDNFELLVIAPDKETLDVVKSFKSKKIIAIKDEGIGKPAALNLVRSKAKGDLLILTDGDVYVGQDSLSHLIKPFEDEKIGAVSGHPISKNKINSLFGYWAYVLTNIAHERRLSAIKNNKRFFCSGYLFAIRKEIFPDLDKKILSEDGFISHNVYEKGYKIDYSPLSKVYVKYPTNFSDWIAQKERSAG